jgi:hypothetical protein
MYRKIPFALRMALPSSFNVEAFAQGSFEGEGDTRRIKLEPKEYPAQVVGPWGDKTKLKVGTSKDGQAHLILEVVWQPDDPEQRQKLGIDRLPTVRQSIFLDVTPNNGLDMGPLKNGDLNRLREVFGMNAPGVQWSFPQFIGKPARIKVTHGANKEDPDNPYVNVSAVSKL